MVHRVETALGGKPVCGDLAVVEDPVGIGRPHVQVIKHVFNRFTFIPLSQLAHIYVRFAHYTIFKTKLNVSI